MDIMVAFDKFIELDALATKAQVHIDERNRLLHEARPKCGNCRFWMTRKCPKEKNVNGRNRGPSMNGLSCRLFEESWHVDDLRKLASKENEAAKEALERLKNRLDKP